MIPGMGPGLANPAPAQQPQSLIQQLLQHLQGGSALPVLPNPPVSPYGGGQRIGYFGPHGGGITTLPPRPVDPGVGSLPIPIPLPPQEQASPPGYHPVDPGVFGLPGHPANPAHAIVAALAALQPHPHAYGPAGHSQSVEHNGPVFHNPTPRPRRATGAPTRGSRFDY